MMKKLQFEVSEKFFLSIWKKFFSSIWLLVELYLCNDAVNYLYNWLRNSKSNSLEFTTAKFSSYEVPVPLTKLSGLNKLINEYIDQFMTMVHHKDFAGFVY